MDTAALRGKPLEGRLESALCDEKRAGRPIDFDDRERSRIVAMVCSKPPKGPYRWTLDLIVEEAQKRGLVSESICLSASGYSDRRHHPRHAPKQLQGPAPHAYVPPPY